MRPLVLGIDLGFTSLGWSIMDVKEEKLIAAGKIKTSPSTKRERMLKADDDVVRTRQIRRGLIDVIDEHKPRMACIEQIPSGKMRGARAARTTALAQGVVIGVLGEKGIADCWPTVNQAKQAAAGSRNATKALVRLSILERISIAGELRDSFEGDQKARERSLKAAKKRRKAKGVGRSAPEPTPGEHVYDSIAAILAAWDEPLMVSLRNL